MLPLPNGTLVTAAADKLIKLWSGTQCVKVTLSLLTTHLFFRHSSMQILSAR